MGWPRKSMIVASMRAFEGASLKQCGRRRVNALWYEIVRLKERQETRKEILDSSYSSDVTTF